MRIVVMLIVKANFISFYYYYQLAAICGFSEIPGLLLMFIGMQMVEH